MTYIDRDDLIAELWNEMSSYKNLGNVDESQIYPTIDLCLYKVGNRTKVYKSSIIDVNRFQAPLPADFAELRYILRCKSVKYTYTNPAYQTEEIYEKYADGLEQSERYKWIGNPRSHKCLDAFMGQHTCTTSCGQNCEYGNGNYFLRQKYNDFSYDLASIEPLMVKTNQNFKYKFQENTVTIQNGAINTQFQEGTIFIEYLSTENNGLIPDNSEIKEAIKNICKHKLFEIMFYNGEQDVMQKMQYSEKFAAIGYSILKKYSATNELSDFYKLRSTMINRYNILENLTKNDFSIIRRF